MGTDVPEVVQTSYGYSFSYMSFIHWPANFPRLGGGAEEQEGASHHSGLILTWLLKTRQSRWSLDHKATGSTSSMIIGKKKKKKVYRSCLSPNRGQNPEFPSRRLRWSHCTAICSH